MPPSVRPFAHSLRPPAATRAAGALGLAVSLTGCSHLSSRPPPPGPLNHPGECSDSRWPVVADVYLATNSGGIALGLFGAAALTYDQQASAIVPSWKPATRAREQIYPQLGVGLLFTAATVFLVKSARRGLASARACDRALSDFHLHLRVPPPRPWSPPAAGAEAPP